MSELSNNFRLGRMEKDLDDRLLINGSYRDALNVEVATSDGSDVGALQKILGNTKVGVLPYMINPVCIGSVRDSGNDKIYWFITSSSKDIIAEYDITSGSIYPVIVDNSQVLKFNTSNLITGVNILDGVLYFTDNLNEPKQVDISFWKNQTVNFVSQSTNLFEDKITVIKKSPLEALTYKVLTSTVVTGYGTSELDSIPIIIKINNSTLITLSTVDVGDTISNIKFCNTDGTNISNPSNNLTYIAKDASSNISGSKITLTNENGSQAIIEILTKNVSSDPYVFTAKLIFKDNDLNLVEEVNFTGQGYDSQRPIVDGSSALPSTIDSLKVYTYQYVESTPAFTIGASANYNISFELDLQSSSLITNQNWQIVIYKNGDEIIERLQESSQSLGLKTISMTNETLLNGETVGVGIVFTTSHNNNTNATLSGQALVIRASATNNLTYSVTTSDVTNEYSAVAEQIVGHFEKKFPRFSYRYKYDNNQYSTYAPFSDIAFIPGIYDYDTKNAFNLGMRNTVSSLHLKNFRKNIPELVHEIDILYKDTLDSNVYIVDTIDKSSQSFTGNGSNKQFTLTTSSYSNPLPTSEDQIIVKITNSSGKDVIISRNSYTYSSPNITFISAEYNSSVQQSDGSPKSSLTVKIEGFGESLEVKDEEIYKVVESMQLLRHFDSVPKKALAQEIVGNRLVYANYTENYSYNSTPTFSLSLIASRTNTFNQNLSLKSNRTYQIGVVFIDTYGRKTPVFTGSSGQFFIDLDKSVDRNFFRISTSTTPPSGISHFQYYIKEPSNEYYNIALSNFYDDDEGFLYLMCSSADINKIKAEDYISLKKRNATNEGFVNSNNKFKVISVSGKTPDFLAKTFNVSNSRNYVVFGTSFTVASSSAQTTRAAALTPVEGFNKVLIKDFDIAGGVPTLTQAFIVPGAKLRFTSNGSRKKSKVYEIGAATFPVNSGVYSADIQFTKSFGKDINFLYDTDSDSSPLDGVGVEFLTEDDNRGDEAYDNKFFIKIKNNIEIKEALGSSVSQEDLTVISSSILQQQTSPSTAVGAAGNRSYYYQNLSTNGVEIITGQSYVNSSSAYYADSFSNNIKLNNYIRISDSNYKNKGIYFSIIYKIIGIKTRPSLNNVSRKSWKLTFDKVIPQLVRNALASGNYRFDVMNVDSINTGSLTNPAVIEVIPDNGLLDIYYEDKDIYPIAELSDLKSLSYSNCISFGNGVESDRIRDDFNAPTIGKGVRVSTVFEETYNEENLPNRFIYSQIYNSSSGVNRLNQFIIADKITKDINPSHGSIQFIKTRDTDLLALCEDKCFRVQANKDALFTADGNPQVTSSSNVLGQIIPYVGEYGISKNPESFAQYGFRAYFTDKSRGVVLRLSRDGLSEVSALGMSDYFSDKLSNATSNLFGSYDDRKNSYNLSFTNQANSDINETISFNERVKGWTSRKSFVPETGLSLNNEYFTFKEGYLYKHHSNSSTSMFYNPLDVLSSKNSAVIASHKVNGDYEFTIDDADSSILVGMYVYFNGLTTDVTVSSKLNTNLTFYFNTILSTIANDTVIYFSTTSFFQTNISSVEFIFNEGVNQVKRFKNISYEGDVGWLVNSIKTNEHSGTPSTFVKKEGKYYSSLSGVAASNTTLNAEEFNVQGVGAVSSVNGSVLTFTSGVNNSIQIGDNVYFLNNPSVAAYTSSGTCTAKTSTTITVSGTAPAQGKFVLFDKGGVINQAGLLGFFAKVEMKHITTDKAEIFSVGSLVV